MLIKYLKSSNKDFHLLNFLHQMEMKEHIGLTGIYWGPLCSGVGPEKDAGWLRSDWVLGKLVRQGFWSGRQGNVSRHYYNTWYVILNLQTAWFYFTSALLQIAEKMWHALMLHFHLTSPVENNFSFISSLSSLLIDIHRGGGGPLSWYAFYSIFLHSSLTFSSPSSGSNSCLSCFLTSVSRSVNCSLSGDLSYITDLYSKCSPNFPLPDFFFPDPHPNESLISTPIISFIHLTPGPILF